MEKEKYIIRYDFIILLTLLICKRFNGKGKISINNIERFIPIFLERANYASNEYHFAMLNDMDSLSKLNKKYDDILQVKDGYIILNDNVSKDELYYLLETFNYPFLSSIIDFVRNDVELKTLIDATKISDTLMKVEEIENKLAEYYLSFAYDDICDDEFKNKRKKNIRLLLQKRDEFYSILMHKDTDYLEDALSDATQMLPSNYLINYYPIDRTIEPDKLFPDSFNYLDEVLNSSYMFAIFNQIDSGIEDYRLYDDINELLIKYGNYDSSITEEENQRYNMEEFRKDSFKNKGFVYTPRDNTTLLFYLDLIKKLNEVDRLFGFSDVHGLKSIKLKLLYLLDNSSYKLLTEEGFENTYNNAYNGYINSENIYYDLEWFRILVKSLIVDIFDGLYDYNDRLVKLAIIKSYYSLTKDSEVLKLLDDYSDREDYWIFRNFIKNEKNYIRVLK